MATLKREATEDAPNVMFDDHKGVFEISKRSLPENAIIFYDPLVAYILDYLKSPKEITNVVFHFDYLSTASTKQIMRIILLFDELAKTKTVKLNWNYDIGDGDMMQTGTRLEKLTGLKFIFNEV
jgi:hypothetical protein